MRTRIEWSPATQEAWVTEGYLLVGKEPQTLQIGNWRIRLTADEPMRPEDETRLTKIRREIHEVRKELRELHAEFLHFATLGKSQEDLADLIPKLLPDLPPWETSPQ